MVLPALNNKSGFWQTNAVNYCVDYLEQGNAIWGRGTASHGEIKLLSNGEYYLANGYNNQVWGRQLRPNLSDQITMSCNS